MPIYDIQCNHCQYQGEVLALTQSSQLRCPNCGDTDVTRMMSRTSSLTGRTPQAIPGAADTTCCGQRPGESAGCSGPGSCCGKNFS